MTPATGALERFWREAEAAPLVFLTDFDFTISAEDVGDLITFTLAPPSDEMLRRLTGGEIGTGAYWQETMARVDLAEGLALADRVDVDPGFAEFVRFCAANRIPLAVVSDGFGFYIRRILGREGLGHLPIFANEMETPGRLTFPGANPLCSRCACCKAAVVRRVKAGGAHVAYAGDGTSDMFASGFVDWVFAKDRLARHMAENHSPFYPLESFAAVQATLAADLAGFQQGTAARRSTLRPDPVCRFA